MLGSGVQGWIVTGRRGGVVMITVVAVAGMLCIDGGMKRLSEERVAAVIGSL